MTDFQDMDFGTPFVGTGGAIRVNQRSIANEFSKTAQYRYLRFNKQIEIYDWQNTYFRDDMGYEIEPYRFYFEKGKNTITLEGVNEPMVIRSLKVAAVEKTASYAEYHAKVPEQFDYEAGNPAYYFFPGGSRRAVVIDMLGTDPTE